MSSNKLAFFPDPYPDEDFRSLLIRYNNRTNSSMSYTMEKLFKIKTKKPNFFPYNLEYLANILPYNKAEFIEDVISNNTFFPIYSLFLPSELTSRVIQDFNKVNINKTLSSLSIRHNIQKHFYFCPLCIKVGEESGKEPYVHRIHQFTNLDICLFHKVKLIYNCPTCGDNLYKDNTKFPNIIDKCKNGHSLIEEVISSIDSKKIQVLKGLYFLLKNYKKLKGFPIYEYYRVYLITKGYMQYSGRLNNKAFYRDFMQFFSEKLFTELGYDINIVNNRLALRIFTKDKYIYDPILHVLAMIFLAGSVEKFVNNSLPVLKSQIPFGIGPWTCLNPLCEYSGQKVITHCKRCITNVDVFGEFICMQCGFHYKIKYDERIPYHDLKKTIIDYGYVWRRKLLEFQTIGLNYTEIGRELKVSRSTVKEVLDLTIETQNSRDNKDVATKGKGIISDSLNQENTISEKLKLLKAKLEKLREDKLMTRTLIRKALGSRNYDLLMKNDTEWMNSILPPRVNSFEEKDWKSIDLSLSIETQNNKDLTTTGKGIISVSPNQEYTISEKLKLLKAKLEQLREDKSMTRSLIRKALGSRNYDLLMKYDTEWMNSILPPRVYNFKEKDWKSIDLVLSEFLNIKIKDLYHSNPQRRITKYYILNQLNSSEKKKIVRYPEKLPFSMKVIQKNIESMEKYQLRIIPQTINFLKETGHSLEPEKIFLFYKFKGCSENVKNEILSLLNYISPPDMSNK